MAVMNPLGSRNIIIIDDNYIGNAKIIFSVDGENYTNITNYEGKALINLNLNSGNYSIHTIFCDLVVRICSSSGLEKFQKS